MRPQEIIKAELDAVKQQIKELQQKEKVLTGEYMNATDNPALKFVRWVESNKGDEFDACDLETNCPITAKILDDWDFNRYQTINIIDYLDDRLALVFEAAKRDITEDDDYNEQEYNKALALAEELMDANAKTYTHDW